MVFDEIGCNARAILGAYLVTLAHQHEGTIKKPAGFFLSRCRSFHQALTEEAEELITRYGSLPHDQVRTALSPSQAISPHIQTRVSQPLAAVPVASSRAARSLFVSGTPRPPEVKVRIPVQPGGGMDRATAERLCKAIRVDRRMLGTSLKLLMLRDESYGVFVNADGTTKIRQIIFYAEQEWLTRSATIARWMDFFSHDQGGK